MVQKVGNRLKFSSFHLRVIALITMIIDHIGTVFFPGVAIYKIIGRVSFPIFAFLIVEGSIYTSNIKAYMNRLLLFAVISEIPYNLAFRRSFIYTGSTNVLFTLYGALLMIHFIKQYQEGVKTWFQLFLVPFGIQIIGGDYSVYGILTVLIFYSFRGNYKKITIAISILFSVLMGGLQVYGILALGILYFYNGSKGRKMGSLFYWAYPAHLIIIYLIYMGINTWLVY